MVLVDKEYDAIWFREALDDKGTVLPSSAYNAQHQNHVYFALEISRLRISVLQPVPPILVPVHVFVPLLPVLLAHRCLRPFERLLQALPDAAAVVPRL